MFDCIWIVRCNIKYLNKIYKIFLITYRQIYTGYFKEIYFCTLIKTLKGNTYIQFWQTCYNAFNF